MMRTRSPSMKARGITATSGRQGRSCEGLMLLNQTTTPRKSAAKTIIFRGVRENQRAQTPNVKKNSARTRRAHPQGRLEQYIDRVAQPRMKIAQTGLRLASNHRSQLDTCQFYAVI